MSTKKRNYRSTPGYGSDGSGVPSTYVEPSQTDNLISALFEAAKGDDNGAVFKKHTSFKPTEQLSLFELVPPEKPSDMTPRQSADWDKEHKDYGYGSMSDSSFEHLIKIMKTDTGLREPGYIVSRNAIYREYQRRHDGESPPGWEHIDLDNK